MTYALGNKCAKNCCKQTILVQLIAENVVTFFLRYSACAQLETRLLQWHDNCFKNCTA